MLISSFWQPAELGGASRIVVRFCPDSIGTQNDCESRTMSLEKTF